MPEVTPEVTPGVRPEVSPGVRPEVTPETAKQGREESRVWLPDEASWERASELVEWSRPFDAVTAVAGDRVTWFPGGTLNASVTCVDRHADTDPSRVAISWEGEPGDRRELTYSQLLVEVSTLARALRGLGAGRGDVVALHLGLLPEIVVAMLACARIGAVHAILPTALPAEALADRLENLGAKVLFTQDGAWRHGTIQPLKVTADEALTAVAGIEHTIVVRRTGLDVAWYEGDRWYHDLLLADRGRARGHSPTAHATATTGASRPGGEPEDLPSDHPLLLMNQAQRRGRAVVVTLGLASTLVSSAALQEWGIAEGDRTWNAGDISWLATQAHGVYGPLSRGETTVLYEGTLDVPTHARAWEIMRRHDVTTLLTTPSVLRTMRGWAPSLEGATAPESLRRVVTYAEPSEASLREWAANELGAHRVSVSDGWGQVELGGVCHLSSPVDPEHLPSVGMTVVGADGTRVPDGEPGDLVLTRAWAGVMLPTSGATATVTDHHWQARPGVYTTGDRVRAIPGGHFEFLGRTDEVVTLSGQLVSVHEVAEILLTHPFIARADVVERRASQGGRYLLAAVVLDPSVTGGAGAGVGAGLGAGVDAVGIARDLGESVRETLGGVARPRMIVFVDHFGDELRGDERRRAIASLPLGDTPEPKHVTWAQIVAAAEHLS